MKERLKTFIASLGITVREFEESVGRTNGYVNNLNGSMGTKALGVILKRYPQLSPTWLIFGEGDMIRRNEEDILRVRLLEAEQTILLLREVNRQQNNVIEAWQALRR